jgi:penicillin-binding protein 2
MFFARKRVIAAAVIVSAFFLIVVSRLFYLQILRGKEYARFSDAYTLREIPIPAPRGRIFDRKGKVLATTRPSFNLLLSLQKVKKLPSLLKEVASELSTTPEALNETLARSKSLPRFQPIVLAADLSPDQVARFHMKKSLSTAAPQEDDFMALDLQVEPLRHYEGGEAFAHVLGYLREIGEEKLKEEAEKHPGRYKPGDVIGAQGLERRFDLELRGQDGAEEKIVDAVGREMRDDALGLREELLSRPPQPGDDLYLTLDGDLQRAAYDALGEKVGAVVVLDVKSGGILAMASRPAYDPERLVANVSRSYWAEINTDERKTLLNRTIQAAYPPGSTFKIVMALAALAEGVVKPDEKLSCPGYTTFGGRRFGCWNSRGHGAVDLYRAIVQSCDVYFYKMGERLGVDRIARYAKALGLGRLSGVDLDFERSGLIPDTEWKQRVKKEEWNPGETLSVAIGQGYDLVTPLQNALMMARVAGRGRDVTPYLVREIGHPNGSRTVRFPKESSSDVSLSEAQWDLLLKALRGVVQDPSGTAHKIALKEITIGGKTGTAQVVGYDTYGRKAQSRKTEDHAWFVAFAPVEDPAIAVSVVVEHGGHGGTAAAPVAQAVIKKYAEMNLPPNGEDETKGMVSHETR